MNKIKMKFKILEIIKCRKIKILLTAIIILTFIFVIANFGKKTKGDSSISVTKKEEIYTCPKSTRHF